MSEPVAQMIKSADEVSLFLAEVSRLLEADDYSVNDAEWNGKVNKTRAYLAEKNISYDDVAEVVSGLETSNYSYTSVDRNSNYQNEEFWVFGKNFCFADQMESLYIKLKVRRFEDGGMLLIMSFHPEVLGGNRRKLKFSYK